MTCFMGAGDALCEAILIHTSVKLVTYQRLKIDVREEILIHTSVKLVTRRDIHRPAVAPDFNPHEREARDRFNLNLCKVGLILIHTSVKLVTAEHAVRLSNGSYFNPHEREARDQAYGEMADQMAILIHTSVKLVTWHWSVVWSLLRSF